MITIISATNRPDSITLSVSRAYSEFLTDAGIENQVFTLRDLPADFASEEMYESRQGKSLELVKQYIEGVEKFVFVIPEYNGSYPGVLKAFIDGVAPKQFRGKKAGIIGLSSGRAGNLRGQEHLTGVLHYLKVMVHYHQPKISQIDQLVDSNGALTDTSTLQILKDHASEMAIF
jgi:NAD(P)H-dependent FMN reductase